MDLHEDVFPTENGDFSIAMLVFWRITAFFSQPFATRLERETVPPAWQAAKASSSSRPQTAEGDATAVNHG